MRVELSRVLSVLAHEMRGPLSVLQGYARLLRQNRGDGPDNPEAAMLDAVMEQTRRLSALSHQATDLATWLDRPTDAATSAVRAAALAQDVTKRVGSPRLTLNISPDAAPAAVRTPDATALAMALAAVTSLVLRDATDAPVTLSVAT